MRNILCFGDSNTYGYDPRNGGRYKENERWTCLLQKLLGNDFNVISEGLNGRTLASDRDGYDWLNGLKHLPSILLTHKPVDVLIIMLGTNDCSTELNLCEKDIEEGTRALVEAARECCRIKDIPIPEIVLAAPAPIGDNYATSPFSYQLNENSVRLSRAISSIQEDIAVSMDCYFLDAGRIAKVASDAEHLTIQGHIDLSLALYNLVRNIYPDDFCDDFFDPLAMIETKRLELRLVSGEDAKDLYKNVFSSDEVLRYFVSEKHDSEETTRLTLTLSGARAIANKSYYFSVIRKDTKEVIGIVLQCSRQNDLFQGTELGYAFGKDFWNMGYATEAVGAVIDFLLSKGLHKVYASHIVENIPSGRVMEKCGMQYEGESKDELYYQGKYHTLRYYSIVKK